MYKVEIFTCKSELCHPGVRYCLTKKALRGLIGMAEQTKCDYEIYKFVHLHSGIFAWSDVDAYEAIEKDYDVN